MTPTAISFACRPRTPSTTPMPHRVRPGSTPSTRTLTAPQCPNRCSVERYTARALPPRTNTRTAPSDRLLVVLELGDHLVGDVAVGEDVLDVVGVLERLDDP